MREHEARTSQEQKGVRAPKRVNCRSFRKVATRHLMWSKRLTAARLLAEGLLVCQQRVLTTFLARESHAKH